MCGILAFFSGNGTADAFQQRVADSLELMHHRGPDDTGVQVIDNEVIFGHKRLSIIDVELSKEPLPYQERYLLTFNGEIYNYLELREELITRFGAEFTTRGDGEVVVAGYHHWGDAVLDRLRGMFAFVIWDRDRKVAFGARDPFGIKPMHYLLTGDGLFLGSEKKALLPFADNEIDQVPLSHLLTFQYVPEPDTLHKGIKRIGAGECLTWTADAGLSTRRYFRPIFHPTPMAEDQRILNEIKETLRDSVRAHMRSDVPVGAFLSSGIDSTSVVALAREFNPEILTFTVGFDNTGYSEVDVAQESARQLGVTTIPTKINAYDMMEELPRIVWHLDDPVADPSLVPLYFVAKKASEYVTVVLSGEGADEFFGGYSIYREPLSLSMLTRLPDPMRRGLRAVSRAIPHGMKGKSFLERGTTPIEERFSGNARIFASDDEIGRLLKHHDGGVRYTDITGPFYAEAAADGLDDVTKMQYVDMSTWLRGDILVKADRMSMAHSLELRVPFLDLRVWAVASKLPQAMKVPPNSKITKWAMRQAVSQVVPPAIVNRPKLGFPVPTRVWLAGEMYQWARDILHNSGARDVLDLSYVEDLLRDHKAGRADNSRKIWTVLVFCVWHAIFVARTLDPGIKRNQSALLTKPPVAAAISAVVPGVVPGVVPAEAAGALADAAHDQLI